MVIKGLEAVGQSPSRQGFLDGLHKLGNYDAAGLRCAPLDLSLENFGKFPDTSCTWVVTVKDGKFVVLNKGKPVTGKLVGAPELLKENRAGTLGATTTSAAPPP